jgi:DNA-binding response OmpR family regulator
MMKVLIIEDEYSLADAIRETLEKEHLDATIVTNGLDGEDEALTGLYDLILLDIMLPKKNGFEILKELKEEKIKTPIIILTAKGEMEDKLNGLENGADDYITKPFHMKELVARVKIVLKRNANIEDTNTLTYGDLTLDLSSGKLICNDKEVSINGKELNLIELLLINKEQIIEKDTVTDKIWGYDSEAEYNTVEVYISFLRKKMTLLGSKVKITTVRGIGYKLEESK